MNVALPEPHKPVETLTDAELCQRFDGDILYDCHSLRARIERSRAARKLRLNGHGMLPAIIVHLSEHKILYDDHPLFAELRLAWGVLLNYIACDLGQFAAAPNDRRDTAAWIAWAKTQTP